jgi:hypothetical protein
LENIVRHTRFNFTSKLILVGLVLFCSFNLFSQTTINFPQERAVFQRDNNNDGAIHVSGNTISTATKVEARLVPMVAGQGIQTDWQLLDDNLLGGSFSGSVKGKGGWYKVELKIFEGINQIGFASLNRIGIGEVFVISGQSNGQGFLQLNPKGSVDDRVNGYGIYNDYAIDENPALSDFKHIDRELNIGPRGQSAWAWGELGDKIAATYNVPVLFFNTAYEGTLIEDWARSSRGEPNVIHSGYKFVFPNNTPYSYLRIILQNHVPLFGLRAVIWIHGESDLNTVKDNYKRDLKFLLEQVERDTGKNINWLITRTSMNLFEVHDQIIQAQDEIIALKNNAFAGPNTDKLQIPRNDGVHFSNDGISLLAQSVFESFTPQMFTNLNPLIGSPIIPLKATCGAGNVANVGVNGNYASYLWNNNNSGNANYSSTNGRVTAILREANGNYRYTETLVVENLVPKAPFILGENGGVACIEDTVTFYTDKNEFNILWQDGTTSSKYKTTNVNAISAQYISKIGCISAKSSDVKARFLDKPLPPTITSLNGSFGACIGESVKLRANTTAKNVRWSTGETVNEIAITSVGESSYTAQSISLDGCVSIASASQEVSVFEKPSPPLIAQDGPYSMISLNPENYNNFLWSLDGKLLNGENQSKILAKVDGYYSIQGTIKHDAPFQATCVSNSSGFVSYVKDLNKNGLAVYPNPINDGKIYLSSNTTINSVTAQLRDINGRNLFRTFALKNLDIPQIIDVGDNVPQGKYILVLNYDGLERKFNLFFK